MSAWTDPARWARLRDGTDCPICRRGTPLDVVATLERAWVTCGERAPMRGYACLVLRRHAVELHDLDDAEGAAFMRDARRLSAAVAELTGAVKLNYEIHGNTIPHLHLHVYPRHVGDAFEERPIDPRAVDAPVYAPGEHAALVVRLRERLRAGPAPH